MQGQKPRFPWAKVEINPDGVSWHPLSDHCCDVGVCLATILTKLPVLRKRLAATGNLSDLTPAQIQRLSILAALHDIGKANRGFQARWNHDSSKAGHTSEALELILPKREKQTFPLQQISGWVPDKNIILQLLAASFSHHGVPVRQQDCWHSWQSDSTYQPLTVVSQIVQQILSWFPEALEPTGDPLPSHPEFQHFFCGLVTLADWIASDTRFFPFSQEGEENRLEIARVASLKALASLGMDVSVPRKFLVQQLPAFEYTFCGRRPYPLQQEMEKLPLPDGPSVVLVESETGSGKTEIAIRYFLRLFRAGLVEGMYFALPTRAAASQIHRRVVQAVRSVWGENSPPVVLAVPGYIRVDEVEATRLPGFEVLWPDEDRYRYRGWAAEHPKRYMAAPIIIGTIDQVLLSTLTVPHAHLRSSSLSRHLLVVDEVHASDPYMTVLLQKVLQHLLSVGSHILLMSATLGSTAACRLLNPCSGNPPPPLEKSIKIPYPAITYSLVNKNLSTISVPSFLPEKKVSIKPEPCASQTGEIANLAVAYARKGAKVAILRNTVADAIRTQVEVERQSGLNAPYLFRCQGVVSLHHSRFSPEDRILLDRAIEETFGRSSTGGALIVCTQTAEQSLDVDFDVMLTDLCPMDVFLQRLGRLHRHRQAKRPPGLTEPVCYVLIPEQRNIDEYIRLSGPEKGEASGPFGLGTVYQDLRVLEATWRLLTTYSYLSLPGQNRHLVENATHPEVLRRITEELKGAWVYHQQKMEGIVLAQRQLASLNLLDRSKPFGESDCLFPEETGEILTRLGEKDRLLRFPEPLSSPFGQKLKTLTVPEWMTKNLRFEEPVVESIRAGQIFFTLDKTKFVYDRLGLRIDKDVESPL